MTHKKESEFSFGDTGKESIADRIRKLIGKRSVRAASQDWGLSFSTLNNYLSRGTEPSLNVATKIASMEGVSVDWLATGENLQAVPMNEAQREGKSDELLRTTWMAAFEFMGRTEAEALLKIIINGGARGLIKLADNEASLEEAFMLLPPELKERAIALVDAHIEAKKGASEGSKFDRDISSADDEQRKVS
ncbi:hypothetical protein NG99_04765 [Erwinia typographi]|uniref:HTH cro/C1-type domain-containing protein n=1 Tax=Erwinia typographi TaxID=371042 RepID=A0A0A4AC05_9GAMM|nr:hypothetical protein [Erwinia typographi]KGT95353.1 hypothetical protein NG99_04765 [Erwinia typographi]